MEDMKLSSPRAHLVPTLFLGLSLAGCLTGKSPIGLLDDGDGSSSASDGEAESSSSDGSTSASPGSEDDSTDAPPSESDGGEPPPPVCPDESGCSQPLACAPEGEHECGGVLGRANEDGCPRQYCTGPGECPTGSSCFLPFSWGVCGPHVCYDDEDTGMCECGFGLDCNNDGLCVPDGEGLPPDTNATDFCGQFTEAGSCEGSELSSELGVCRWYEGWQLPQEATCEEREEVGRCVFSAAFIDEAPVPACPSDESLRPMAFVDAGIVTVLFVDPADAPTAIDMDFDDDSYGWLTCDQPEVEGACACASE